jgi:hypothetical protein
LRRVAVKTRLVKTEAWVQMSPSQERPAMNPGVLGRVLGQRWTKGWKSPVEGPGMQEKAAWWCL